MLQQGTRLAGVWCFFKGAGKRGRSGYCHIQSVLYS